MTYMQLSFLISLVSGFSLSQTQLSKYWAYTITFKYASVIIRMVSSLKQGIHKEF